MNRSEDEKMLGVSESRKYTGKEIAIFDAVAHLLSEGLKPHELKVARIAQVAGIGKGTAYEYFDSKEDLLRAAIYYYIQKIYHQTADLIAGAEKFRQAFFDLLNLYSEMMYSSLPNIWSLMSSIDLESLLESNSVNLSDLNSLISQAETIIGSILRLGEKEGLINKDISTEEKVFAFNGIVSAYIYSINSYMCYGSAKTENYDDETYKQLAWKMLLKTLGK